MGRLVRPHLALGLDRTQGIWLARVVVLQDPLLVVLVIANAGNLLFWLVGFDLGGLAPYLSSLGQ